MAMRCPKCRAMAKTRTSFEMSDMTRKAYHQCQNMLCGYCFTSLQTISEPLNQTTPAPGASIPIDAFPKSNYGEGQLDLTL